VSGYFEDLDPKELNDFQRRVVDDVSAILSSVDVDPGRTHARRERGRPPPLWLTVVHRDRPEYNLHIVVETGSIVVNLGPAHEHFGYGEPDPEVGEANSFIESVLIGAVELDLTLRGRTVVKTEIFLTDGAGDRRRMSTEANILALVLAPFLRRRRLTERISFV
jgi:hypothetical protein